MDRILATHTGSLIRPPELLAFLAAKERGQSIDEDAYQSACETRSSTSCAEQVEAGIDVVDDGEMGKASWITYLYERVSGLEVRPIDARGREHAAAEPRPSGVPRRLCRAGRAREAAERDESNAASSSALPDEEPRSARAWPGCAPAR